MPELTVQRRANLVILRLWFDEVPGWSEMKLRPLEDGSWWIDLVRVGSPQHRGLGYGSQLLEAGKKHALEELGASNLGLEPHPLSERIPFDLRGWYVRHGFVHEDGDKLWLRPLNDEGTR